MTQATKFQHIAASFISKLPMWPPSLVLGEILNQALNPLIVDRSLLSLDGKHIAIIIEDLGLHLRFTLCRDKFIPTSLKGESDLTLRSTLSDFYLLATRQEDPDTLFFNRRLVIEGETELGLIAKNALDSLEIPKPLLALYKAQKKLDAFKNLAQNQKTLV